MPDNQVVLQTYDALLREKYAPLVPELVYYHGAPINRIIEFSSEVTNGKGYVQDVITKIGDSVRSTAGMLDDFDDQKPFGGTSYNVRWNESDSTLNDFRRLNHSIRVTLFGTRGYSDKDIAVDPLSKMVADMPNDYSRKLGLLRTLDKTALTAAVSGTPKNADAPLYADATAYTTGSTSVGFKITSGPIAAFQPGTLWEVRNQTTGALQCGPLEVTAMNTQDNFVRFAIVTNINGASSNCNSVAASGSIYPFGCYNAGIFSIGEWLKVPVASETFIGGLDRTSAANGYLLPTRTRQGATSAPLNKSMFDAMGSALSYRNLDADSDNMTICMAHTPLVDTIRQEIANNAFVQFPVGSDMAARVLHFGASAVVFQHPYLGSVLLQANPIMPTDKVWFIRKENWQSKTYQQTGVQVVQGDAGAGGWYREGAQNTANGKGLGFRHDSFMTVVDVCNAPALQGVIDAVTAAPTA